MTNCINFNATYYSAHQEYEYTGNNSSYPLSGFNIVGL